MLTRFLRSAGIRRVVWIDDFFAKPSRDAVTNAMRTALFEMKGSEVRAAEAPPLPTIDLTLSRYDIEEQLDAALADLSYEQMSSAADRLGIRMDKQDIPEDLPREAFDVLQAALGGGLQTFGLNDWMSQASARLKDAGIDTLFLIDKQFSREDTAYDGLDLLQDLVQGDAFYILLTYTCAQAEQNSERVNIARQSGGTVPAYRFAVVSKQGRDLDKLEQQFAEAIYAVLTHRYTGEIASTIRNAIHRSADTTVEKVAGQSVFDLDLAFFENSHKEGVPEFDVVVRIFNIEQRYRVSESMREPKLQEQLRKARKFRKDTASFRGTWPKPALDLHEFREWRRREVYDDGAALNAIHTPLACGDVFEVALPEGNAHYAFLAQPCDLMVRGDGKRNAEMGLLALLADSATVAAKEGTAGHRYFGISGVSGGGEDDWYVDFANTAVVDLAVLELAVFNSEGKLQLVRNQAEPDILLPPGWLKRLGRAKALVFPTAGAPVAGSLAAGRFAELTPPNVTADAVSYNVQRVGRLETNIATAILAAWATFQTRAALEHDFARLPRPQPRRRAPSDAELQERAYFISLERHRQGMPGTPEGDWEEAKRQLT